MARRTFTFCFQEMPLIIDGPFEDNGVNGEAVISYGHDGSWGVASIGIAVARWRTPAEMSPLVHERRVHKIYNLDAGTPLHSIIWSRLEDEWHDRVQAEVREQIAADIDAAADNAADVCQGRAA